MTGSSYYISPEVLNGHYDKDCDLWSAGCILYVFLCGYPPFQGSDQQSTFKLIMKSEFDFEEQEWISVSKEAKDLI